MTAAPKAWILLLTAGVVGVSGCRKWAPPEEADPLTVLASEAPTPWPGSPEIGFEAPDVPEVRWTDVALQQQDSLTVDAARGLVWERDPMWRLEGFSVPHVWRMGDGRFGLAATNNIPDFDDHPRWRMYGDGRVWDAPEEGWWPDDFDPKCSEYLVDMAVRVDPSGAYDYVFVGQDGLDSELCWLSGDEAAGPGGPFTLTGMEDVEVGVPAFLMQPDGSSLFYFIVADEADNGLYVATVERNGRVATPLGAVVPHGNIDPMPMHLSGGGVRLYHTVGNEEASFGIGYTDLGPDGKTAQGDPQLLVASNGDCTKTPTGECLVDPAIVRVPDGGLVMYFGAIDYGPDGTDFQPSIQRAFAVD